MRPGNAPNVYFSKLYGNVLYFLGQVMARWRKQQAITWAYIDQIHVTPLNDLKIDSMMQVSLNYDFWDPFVHWVLGHKWLGAYEALYHNL